MEQETGNNITLAEVITKALDKLDEEFGFWLTEARS